MEGCRKDLKMAPDKPYQITALFRAVLKPIVFFCVPSRFVIAAICLHVELLQIRQAKRVSALLVPAL